MTHHPNILVTRPHPAGSELCQILTENGYRAIHFPTIDFAHAQFSTALRDHYDWFIYTSPQAVYFSADDLTSHSFPKTKIAAIGEGTANALIANGFDAIVYPASEWNSEGLLALAEFKEIMGQKIAIIGGVGGRELLEQTLHARGAEVIKINVYQRILPKIDPSLIRQIDSKKIDVIVCTSCEGLLNLTKLLPEILPVLHSIPLIIPSLRIKKLAQHLNFQTIWLTPNTAHQSILQTLAQKKELLWQMKS